MTRKKIYTSDNPRYEAVKAYREAKKIVRVPLDMPSDEADALRTYCTEHGLTVAGFIRGLIREAIAGAAGAGTRGGYDQGITPLPDSPSTEEQENDL